MRQSVLKLIAGLAVIGAGVDLRSWAQDSNAAVAPRPVAAPASDTRTLQAVAGSEIPDLTGYWRLDVQHSDPPWARDLMGGDRGPGMRRDGGRMRREMGGDSVGRGQFRGGRRGAGRRAARLPNLIHVTHTPSLMSFEDSTGTVVQEIATVAATDTSRHASGVRRQNGQWKAGRLEVQRPSRRGTIIETYSLEANGQTLVIHTRAESDSISARDFKRVYRRES
jgi:hypothetical protein